jgi:hypothetical protein
MTPNTIQRSGKVRYALAAWLLGAPTILIIVALIWGGVFNW